MNIHLEKIKKSLQDTGMPEAEQASILKAIADADKQWAITDFKLDRTEKVKKTTAILLEETIEELEQKRKAVEVQNHELEIETALERVRAVAMAMRKADDLLDICKVVYNELQILGFSELRNTMINIYDDVKGSFLNYDYSDNIGSTVTNIPYDFHPLVEKQVLVTKNAQDAFFDFSFAGNELKQFRELRKNNGEIDDPKLEITDALYYYFFSIGTGSIGISTYSAVASQKLELLKRFRNVFDLAYKRYTDISNAELQAREAQVQLALERVRARTMAMHRSDELAVTSSILFQQIKELGFETWSCGFCIWKDDEIVEAWMGANSGELLPALMIPYKEENTHHEIFKAAASGETAYEKVWEGKELEEHYRFLRTIPSAKKAFDTLEAAGSNPPARQCYYVGFFKNGYLLLITTEANPELKQISSRFANVFDLTYTRFLDLQKAEAQAVRAVQDLEEIRAARKKAEEALTELQSAQKQLVQSEKMASLGELTAGIAHEIQNPLNFVNNFSEVSNELIDEMNEELDKGDLEEARAIAADIKSNLEKINHHGKRADGIVKGMLQHSRKGDGKKEPTDINVLCDEYVRLSFHGLRAKDKSFNAALQTDFDESIGTINIIPQDIGRVILNLLTNAFYAVDEKAKTLSAVLAPPAVGNQEPNFQPTVSIKTTKVENRVQITVSDNGNGIPKEVIDKIFQPFFTTKPTGQGTGLGLSLAYDIVKAHGGELEVETEEGKGTIFIIQLPI